MNKKSFSLLICLILLITSFSISAQNKINNNLNKNSHIIIYVDNPQNTADILKSKGFDVLYNSITANSLELIVNQDEYKILNNMDLQPVVLSYGKPFFEIQSENFKTFSQIPPGYHSLSEIINEMNNTQNAFPSICRVYDLTEHYNLNTTYEGRHIYAMKISDNVLNDEDEPNFLMVSCHHAREIVTPVIALYSISQFTTNYGIDPVITEIVNNYEIWISPVWNVDGYEYVYNVDNYWRKNRHPYPPGIGVDLNRNYPFGWYSSGSGSTDPTSETYKGPYPAS
ncbi:MAG: M14 family zinc carboxypeptidase, partial [Candidatus Thermoplasmatota archaeon]|nr:M14 family zinc carboxypeptidase [Candidatus Thermoplasmatota archaeon]